MAFTAMLTGCGEPVSYINTPSGNDGVALQIAVKGVKPSTRSIIEGTQFPNDSTFAVFAMFGGGDSYVPGGENIKVTYKDGVCTPVTPILIPENVDVPVYAFYPASSAYDVNKTEIKAVSQTDYLWGSCINDAGNFDFATSYAPKVSISFEHIMARITLRIHRAEDNGNAYELPSISLGGDSEGTYRSAVVSVKNKKFEGYSYDSFENLVGEVSGNVINADIPLITADFLVIPSKTSWWLMLDDAPGLPTLTFMPVENYESGNQYIYDVMIANPESESQEASLQITQFDILPWGENNDMGDVEAFPVTSLTN